MRVRLRHVLPVAQMLVAIGLYRWSDLWLQAAQRGARHEPYMGSSPGFDLLVALNAPLVFVKFLCYRMERLWYRYPHGSTWWTLSFPELMARAIFILTIGMLWYWVVQNFESWRSMRTVYTFSQLSLRLLSDGLLMAMGLICGSWLLSEYQYLRMPLWQSWWHWISIPCLATWAVFLIFFFGRDFVNAIRGKSTPSGSGAKS